jgi:magnesium chelatase subunit D
MKVAQPREAFMPTEQPKGKNVEDAIRIAALLALDPVALGGVVLRGGAGLQRDAWLKLFRSLLGDDRPVRSAPRRCEDDRLLGGLDLVRTLALRRPVSSPGLLVEVDGGVVILLGAERLGRSAAARVTGAMDRGHVVLQRDGFHERLPARFGVFACEEAREVDERVPEGLADRLAFRLDLDRLGHVDLQRDLDLRGRIVSARTRFSRVRASDEVLASLCQAAVALGIESLRAPVLALRVARAAAALAGREFIAKDDAHEAVRLVLGPRATQMPVSVEEGSDEAREDVGKADEVEAAEAPTPPELDDHPSSHANDNNNVGDDHSDQSVATLADLLVATAAASLPEGVLAQAADSRKASRPQRSGRVGSEQDAKTHGRPVGVRKGLPRDGARLSLIATLRAAAPWQPLRCAQAGSDNEVDASRAGKRGRIEIRAADLHINKLKRRAETATIFVVDASGSSALNRMAEAKGAVELLLGRCYTRRDWVALISLRGTEAQLVLPPTHALARAKRLLGGFTGGGGTPLASGLDLARETAELVRRKGQQPTLVVLTDGRANVCRNGKGDRARAAGEAEAAARAIRCAQIDTIVIDTSPQPRPEAQKIAAEAGGTYIPLPHARADRLADLLEAEVRGSA